MTRPALTKSLATLVTLREREVDHLQAGLAEKRKVRARFCANLDRMQRLCAGSGFDSDAPGPLPLALSLNFAHYKQHLLQVADEHRTDLALHEADMAVAQQTLNAATHRWEALAQVLAQQERRAMDAARAGEQKQQDEMASQLWARRSAT